MGRRALGPSLPRRHWKRRRLTPGPTLGQKVEGGPIKHRRLFDVDQRPESAISVNRAPAIGAAMPRRLAGSGCHVRQNQLCWHGDSFKARALSCSVEDSIVLM